MIRITTENAVQMVANALGGPVLYFATTHSGWSPQGPVPMGPPLEALVKALPTLSFETVLEMWSHHEGWVSFASADELNRTVSALSMLSGVTIQYAAPEPPPDPQP